MTGILLAARWSNRVPKNTKIVAGDFEKELRRSAETWRKWYVWLQWYFPDEEAHEYAEELTQVTDRQKTRDRKMKVSWIVTRIRQDAWATRIASRSRAARPGLKRAETATGAGLKICM